MECDKCGNPIEPGEERQMHGRILCEVCYMDALSPPRACDPWAVHTARSFSKEEALLNETQKKILEILRETHEIEPEVLAEKLGMRPTDLEREIAALRHVEKVRGAMRGRKKVITLW